MYFSKFSLRREIKEDGAPSVAVLLCGAHLENGSHPVELRIVIPFSN